MNSTVRSSKVRTSAPAADNHNRRSSKEHEAIDDASSHDQLPDQGFLPPVLISRVAAALFLVGGIVGTGANLVLPMENPLGAILSPLAAIVGGVAWFLPWQRWPRTASLWPIGAATSMITASAAMGALDAYSYGSFYTLVFAWIGMTSGRWKCLMLAAPGALLYAAPLFISGQPRDAYLSVLLVIPICVTVGEAIGFMVSRLRMAERALTNALGIKDDFLELTSHELRTPITSILGISRTLTHHWPALDDEKKRELVDRIEANGWTLSRMIETLVAITRARGGALTMSPTLVEVRSLVDQVIETFGVEGHAVDNRCPEGIKVLADTDFLGIILSHYIANALHYGKTGVRVDGTTGATVTITVTDFGEGVPEEFEPQLFKRFSQASTGTTRIAKGLGLGLSIAQHLAEAQSGRVFYRRNEPHGSIFGVELPGFASATLGKDNPSVSADRPRDDVAVDV